MVIPFKIKSLVHRYKSHFEVGLLQILIRCKAYTKKLPNSAGFILHRGAVGMISNILEPMYNFDPHFIMLIYIQSLNIDPSFPKLTKNQQQKTNV